MKNKLDLAIKWLVLSSRDPNKASLTVKAILGLLVAKLLAVAGLVNYHGFDAQALNQIVDGVSLAVQYGLGFISAAAAIYGAAKKVVSTFQGTNAVVLAHVAAQQ